ncbi:MAG TPA: lipid-A-disaccharide synthase [Sphingobacteriaceae bacterium]|nr:lipid-A-disaccharide synthase [Sphingobacteriaceae bacterium]
MNYYIIAGETSGDLHGANLIHALKQEDPEASFRIVGGDEMQKEASETPILHTSEMSFMGFIEVLANISTVLKNLKKVKADLLENRPDALILIDFPGFNLKIAEFAKTQGIKVFYYISPKVWAWNQKRVLKIKKVVDHLFCILPFEVDFYKKWGMEVDYVGNPLLDALSKNEIDPNFRTKNGFNNKPIVALLPGSRKMEISKLMPLMVQVSAKFPTHQFVIAGAPNFSEAYYQQFLNRQKIPVVFDATYDLLMNADAAIVASGTATLETALLRVPEVVVYKANALSVWIARKLVKIRYISLVNLIMDSLVVQELIQDHYNEENVHKELDRLLNDKAYRERMLQNYDALINAIGEVGASERTAKLIVNYLSSSLK